MKLTIGMAVYDDFDGVYFTVQDLRKDFAGEFDELIVVDNHPGPMVGQPDGTMQPSSPHGAMTWGFLKSLGDPSVRYIPSPDPVGTSAPRQRVFDEAAGELVLCLDPHVFLMPGSLTALKNYFANDERRKHIASGPLLYDHLKSGPSLFFDVWSGEMRGIWATAWQCQCTMKTYCVINANGVAAICKTRSPHERMEFCEMCGRHFPQPAWEGHEAIFEQHGLIPVDRGDGRAFPFEVEGQGLGAFAMLKRHWPGFNSNFRGFGGEELYIHEKVRRAGGKAVCLPGFRWVHRFGRPAGVSYPLSLWNKARNYLIGHRELGLDVEPIRLHFVVNGRLTPKEWDELVAGDPPPLAPSAPPAPGCGACNTAFPKTLDEWYAKVISAPSDIHEHVKTLRDLAATCEHVTEFGVRHGVSTIALLAGQPRRLVSWDVQNSAEAVALKTVQGKTDFEFRIGDSRTAAIEATDLLFIDTIHTGAHVLAELANAADKVRKYLVFHDTEAPWGEKGEDGGPGVMPAIREFLWKHPEWTVKKHYPNNHGLTVLSRLAEDRKELPGKLAMAWNMAKSQTRHALNGGRYLPLPLAIERGKFCAVCEHRVAEQCSKCGCHLRQIPDDAPVRAGQPGKLFYPADFCPLGYWHPQPDAGVDMTPEEVKTMLEGI